MFHGHELNAEIRANTCSDKAELKTRHLQVLHIDKN